MLAFVCLLALCFVGTYILSQPTHPVEILVHLVPVAIAILLSMYVAELVGVTERPLPPISIESVFWSVATSCIVMAFGYALLPTYAPSTLLACSAPVIASLAVFMHSKWKEWHGVGTEAVPAVIFAGSRQAAARGMAGLADATGLTIRGVVLPERIGDRSAMAGIPVYKPNNALTGFDSEATRLFVVGDAEPDDLKSILAPCAGAGCIVETVGELVAKAQGIVDINGRDDLGLLARLTHRANRFSAQRFVDIALGLLLLPPTLVLCILTAIAIKLTSRGPVLFSQKRVGRWGREFSIYKFRTMRVGAEKETGPVWATEADPRVTRIGYFLRRTRLDEMPQLWNVLRGDMSLVGPRPERRYFVDVLSRQIPLYDARHSVRPGLTGWAQVRYSYGATEEDARKKLGYELFYILNRSLTFYFAVLLETIKVIVFRRGSR
jgi:exopolysaccharide biosynthesis polyprenyl glycosylphosphotransferase